MLFQSTPPHGERRRYRHRGAWYLRISIHAPRMGSDTSVSFLSVDRDLFQSTLPHGERLTGKGVGSITISISIHAPAWRATAAYGLASSTSAFQSTLPHGERRRIGIRRIGRRSISIHAPRMGSDERPAWCIHRACYFNPRSRMGSDPFQLIGMLQQAHFNPRSRMGSDMGRADTGRTVSTFQSTLPHGERQLRIS